MKRLIVLLALVGVMLTGTPGTALAADFGDVNATVTARFISLQLTVNNAEYGVLNVGDVNKEPASPAIQLCSATQNPAFRVTNNGNADEEFLIKGFDSAGWALVPTTPGEDQYVHRFATDPTTCSFASGVLTTSDETLADPVTAASFVDTYLQLDMPSSSTDNDAQILKITITATQS